MLNTVQLLERLTKEYQSTADYVVRGLCISIEDYRAQCSRLRTIEQVEAIAKGDSKKVEEHK